MRKSFLLILFLPFAGSNSLAADSVKDPAKRTNCNLQVVGSRFVNSCENDVSKIDEWSPTELQEVRIVPHKNSIAGNIDGFKFVEVKKDSVFDEFGFRQNDLVVGLNSNTILKPVDIGGLYSALTKDQYAMVQVIRDGKLINLNFKKVSPASVEMKSTQQLSEEMTAEEIVKKHPFWKASEILVWDKVSGAKDNAKLENYSFTVEYPKCFSLDGEEGEPEDDSNPKKSPRVSFMRKEECPSFEKSMTANSQTFSIGYKLGDTHGKQAYEIDGRSFSGSNLYSQKMKINGTQAVMYALVIDNPYGDCEKKCPQLRTEIVMVCKNRIYGISRLFGPGKESLDHIESGDYSYPEEFKNIITSFSCKKVKDFM